VVPEEALARNPLRFAGLMDVYGAFPFGKQDMDGEHLRKRAEISAYHSLFDREPAGSKVSRRPNYDYTAFDREKHQQGFEKMKAMRAEMESKKAG